MVGGSDNGARRVEDRRATGVSVYLGWQEDAGCTICAGPALVKGL